MRGTLAEKSQRGAEEMSMVTEGKTAQGRVSARWAKPCVVSVVGEDRT